MQHDLNNLSVIVAGSPESIEIVLTDVAALVVPVQPLAPGVPRKRDKHDDKDKCDKPDHEAHCDCKAASLPAYEKSDA